MFAAGLILIITTAAVSVAEQLELTPSHLRHSGNDTERYSQSVPLKQVTDCCPVLSNASFVVDNVLLASVSYRSLL